MVGQEAAVKVLRGYCAGKAIPHAVLFTGPSGCGKTSGARILARKAGAAANDIIEHNCADVRGIDTIRNIHSHMRYFGLGRKGRRVYILDEVHQLTNDAQTALLKTLEDPPGHVYFFLCTTHPQKVIETVRSRCKPIVVRPLKADDLKVIVKDIAKKEGFKLYPEVLGKIAAVANGSPRRAINALEQVMQVKGRENQIEAIQPEDVEAHGYELFRLLLNARTNWSDVAALIKGVKQNAEGVRRIMLACCTTAMTGEGRPNPRVLDIIEAFRDSFVDCDAAGLVAASWEVLHAGRK
jgi:DNA polymerase III gamma/tau subunit